MTAKKITLFLTAALITMAAFSQTQELAGIKKIYPSSITPIFEGKETKGYCIFFKSDKADKKNDNYHLNLYDENLAKTATIDMQKPAKGFYMLGNGYNGTELGFYFYNDKEDKFEIDAYDKSLKKVATVKLDHKLTNMEKTMINQRQKADENDQSSLGNDLDLYPVEGKGFMINGILKNGKGFTLEMFDNKLKSQWKYTTDEKSKDYENYLISEVTDKYIVGNLVRRPSLMSRKMDFFIVTFDVETGKKIMEVPVEDKAKEQLLLSSIIYERGTNQILAIGDYYELKDKPGSSKSKGFFVKSFDEQGKETNKKFYSWAKDVKKMMPSEADESLEKGSMNYTHKVIRGQDGKLYLVCEQFSRVADGLGIASNILAGGYGSNMTKCVVRNLIVFVLNPDYTLSDIKFYEKDKSSVDLPAGADFYGPGITGMFTKALGGFDYQFTQSSNDGKGSDIVYINYDKEKGESKKKMLGNILISGDGKFTQDKIDITSKAYSSFLYPAKPGYLMMVDFLKREKSRYEAGEVE